MRQDSTMGDSDHSTDTYNSMSRQVQFGHTKSGSEESSNSSDSFDIGDEVSSGSSDNVNERLRHQVPQIDQSLYTKHLNRVLASVCTVTLQQCHQEVVILREVNRMSRVEVNLEYVPLDEKYNNAEHDVEVIIESENEEFLTYRKFKKDLSWIEKVLRAVIINLQRSFYFDDLTKILNDDEMTREEEQTLLSSKKFNQSELRKLRQYMESERRELTSQIQKVTEELGNLKDELNDSITERYVKLNFLQDWEKARHEQNSIILKNKEDSFSETTRKMMIEIEKENRVHDEVWRFLEDSLEDYQQGIETWMEKYDNDMDEHEQAVQTIQVETEQQKEEYQRLLDKYNARQQEMEDYKEHKLQAQREAEELERRTQAAIKIQSWWRGIMFRKGLGPFRRKKGKGKRGGSAKHSAKKKKK